MPRQDLPLVDDRLCTLCGDCVQVCPTDCLLVVRGVDLVVRPQDCISCGICASVCPVAAIAMQSQAW